MKIILCDYILDFDFDGLLCLDEDGESKDCVYVV